MTTEKKTKISPKSIVREIKRGTRRKFTAAEKIRIVLEGLRGEDRIKEQTMKRRKKLNQMVLLQSLPNGISW